MVKVNEKNVEEYITKSIGKSGFPLEIMSSILLEKHGWAIDPHVIFFNENKKEYSEVDIIASKKTRVKDATDVLIIECKKQFKKPWVLFEGEKTNQNVTSLNIAPLTVYGVFEKYFKNHYYFNKKPCSFHFPTFIKKRSSDVILEAIVQVLDALLFFWEQEVYSIEEYKLSRVTFFYPIIILDGRLFSAHVKPNGEIESHESNYLQLKVTRALREPEKIRWSESMSKILYRKDFIIDVVRKDYIEEFLKNF